jgi:hypothetical protein
MGVSCESRPKPTFSPSSWIPPARRLRYGRRRFRLAPCSWRRSSISPRAATSLATKRNARWTQRSPASAGNGSSRTTRRPACATSCGRCSAGRQSRERRSGSSPPRPSTLPADSRLLPSAPDAAGQPLLLQGASQGSSARTSPLATVPLMPVPEVAGKKPDNRQHDEGNHDQQRGDGVRDGEHRLGHTKDRVRNGQRPGARRVRAFRALLGRDRRTGGVTCALAARPMRQPTQGSGATTACTAEATVWSACRYSRACRRRSR